MEGRLQSLVSNAPSGEWEIYLHDLRGRAVVEINADAPLHPGSTIKVAIAIAFLLWRQAHPQVQWTSGPVPHQRSFEQLLRAMVVVSEEDATASLTDFLMRQERIDLNREVQSWGASQTSVVPRRSTARDLGIILEHLASGDLLTPEGTDYLLDLMRIPTPSKETRLGAGLPAGPRDLLAHKTGTTFEQGLGVVADSGWVQWQGASYVIVVLSNRVQWVDYDSAMALIAEISRVAFACLVPGAAAVSTAPHRGGPVP
jgi:beta-lactamase class A